MRTVVLTGPLSWPPLLRAVLGAVVPGDRGRVVVPDAAIAAGGCFPPLVPVAGAGAEGRLIAIADAQGFERLSWFAAAIGLAPVPRHVRTGARRRAALAFMAEGDAHPPAPEWRVEPWAARWGAIALAAAAEIMAARGARAASALTPRLPMILARAAARTNAAAAPAPADLRSATAADSVERIASRASHAGFFLTEVHDLRHPLLGGGMSPPLRRELFVASDAALVLPYDPARDRVLLVEQFRMGPFGRGDPLPFVLEPVAGRIDAGETPEATARREAMEEAGLRLRALEHITSHYCSPGCSTEFFHCFLGLADLPDTGPGHGGLATEHEDIRTHVLDFDAAMALLASGEINVGPLVLMLLWLQRERPRLRGAP